MPTISSAPIHTLNNDVLAIIFAINADMLSNRQPLLTTCIASQVCGKWRNLIRNTPALWARLFNSEELYAMSGHEWCDRLVQRSRDALLWIRVINTPIMNARTTSVLRHFFLTLIQKNWHRIQKLFIDDHSSGFGFTPAMLCFPAPNLEEFETLLSSHRSPYSNHKNTSAIFSGHAPNLRAFCLRGHVFDHRAPWLRRLHSMELDDTYSIRDILTILSSTRELQNLRVHDAFKGDFFGRLPMVSLPHLKHLDCYGYPHLCSTVLDHVKIPLGCALTIQIIHQFGSVQSKNNEITRHLLSVFNTFTQYVQLYLQSGLFNGIQLHYYENEYISLEFRDIPSNKCLLSMTHSLRKVSFSEHGETILKQLTSLDLTRITHFEFKADSFGLDRAVESFLGNLHYLDSICVDCRTLRSLMSLESSRSWNSENHTAIFFPFLRVIFCIISSRIPVPKQLEVFGKFIMSRAQKGCVITTLDMTRSMRLRTMPDLGMLAEVKGLKVMYKCSQMRGTFEYSSGSDSPEIHPDTM